jgi:hypothetical protein
MLEGSMTPEQRGQFTEDAHKKALENLRKLVLQHRVGHFPAMSRMYAVDGESRAGIRQFINRSDSQFPFF